MLEEEDCGGDDNSQVRARQSKDVTGRLECMCVRETSHGSDDRIWIVIERRISFDFLERESEAEQGPTVREW